MATSELRDYTDTDDRGIVLESPSVELKPWVHTEPAPQADCCGAIGCRTEEYLILVDHPDTRPRVLCPDHSAGFIRREGGVR
jgi:hypothetical protein